MLTAMGNFFKDFWAVCTKQVNSTSAKKKLCRVDYAKILRNAFFVGGSASILFIIENIAQDTLSAVMQGLAITVLNGIVEAIFRAIRNNKGDENGQE